MDITTLRAGDTIRATKGTTSVEGVLEEDMTDSDLALVLSDLDFPVEEMVEFGWTIERIKEAPSNRPLPEVDGLYVSRAATTDKDHSLAYATVYRKLGVGWWDGNGSRSMLKEVQHVHNNSPLVLLVPRTVEQS